MPYAITEAASITATALVAIANATTGIVTASNLTAITAATVAQATQLFVTDSATLTLPAAVPVTLSDDGSAAEIEAILTATTGIVSAILEDSYTTGGTLTVAVGDVIDIDTATTTTALDGAAEAALVDVDAPGEWFFGTNLFTWWDDGETIDAVSSITLTGVATVNVSGDTITIASMT